MISMAMRMCRQLPPTQQQAHGQDLRPPRRTRPRTLTTTAFLPRGVQHHELGFQLDRRTNQRVQEWTRGLPAASSSVAEGEKRDYFWVECEDWRFALLTVRPGRLYRVAISQNQRTRINQREPSPGNSRNGNQLAQSVIQQEQSHRQERPGLW
jgi:hypothetical protein